MPDDEIPEFVRTLTAAGFELSTVERKPNFLLFHILRTDEFGIPIRYLIAYAGKQRISPGDAEVLRKLATHEAASVVIVSDSQEKSSDQVVLSTDELFGKLGGTVSSLLPLEPDYADRLVTLGFNKLPPGFKGRADDLFEIYAHAGLQFLLPGRVIRYGQERRFEAVPDGLAFGNRIPFLLYDCKAAEERYEFTATTIRQFADYINDFHRRYENYLGRLHSFLAISSAFQDVTNLRDRSDELYAKCKVPLVCLTAKDLARMVALFAQHIAIRSVVDWTDILRPPIIDLSRVETAVQARLRDNVIRE